MQITFKKQGADQMKTRGVKNSLNNNQNNSLDKFWELNKLAKKQNQENRVRTQELMIDLARDILDYELILVDYPYYDYITKFAGGKVVKNSYGKKLYVKIGEFVYQPKSKQIGECNEKLTIIECDEKIN